MSEKSASSKTGKRLERINQYVTENFKLLQCRRYVRVDFAVDKTANNGYIETDDCACGRSFDWHKAKGAVLQSNDQGERYWSVANDTQRYPSNAYGSLLFAPGEGFDSSTIEPGASAFYLRFATEQSASSMDAIYKLMTLKTLWALPVPQMIIEVAGNDRKLQDVDQIVIDRFTNGLVKAAKMAKAWIVTGGKNVGFVGLVGDAVSKARMSDADSDITCLGITNWSFVHNRDQLMASEPNFVPSSIQPDNNDSANLTPVYQVERPENCEFGIPLNPGHNCFLFVDNGREKRLGESLLFRAQFLHYVSRKVLQGAGNNAVTTPLVLLVVGGGITTLKTVELSLGNPTDEQGVFEDSGRAATVGKWSRPVVVLRNFGGVSDLLAFAYEITEPAIDKENWEIPHDFDMRIQKNRAFDQVLQLVPDHVRWEEGANLITRIRRCLKYRDMITVVDLSNNCDYNEQTNLDQAIFTAVLKSIFLTTTACFALALQWNRVDIAKELLMRHDRVITQQIDMKSALNRALLNGQNDVFRLLVEYGLVDLSACLTRHQIRYFYHDIFIKRRGIAGKASCVWLFRSFLFHHTREEKWADVTDPGMLREIGAVLSSILGCYLNNVFTDEVSYKSTVANVKTSPIYPVQDVCPYETSLRDLFVLQLLLLRQDMAVYIWKRGHDHLGTALMAAVFLKSLSKEANRLDMTDLGSAYKEGARDWRSRAVNLLASCYEQDPHICSRLLTRSLLTWQGATTLEIAFYGNMKKFMEQPAVQTTISQVWMGQLATFTRQQFVYLAIFPPLLPFLIFRLPFELTKSVHPKMRHLSTTGEKELPSKPGRVGTIDSDAEKQTRPPMMQLADSFLSSSNRQDVKFSRAALFNVNNKNGRISVFTAIYLLYSSPIAKYGIHSISAAAFLFIFSCFLLDGTQEKEISSLEIFIWLSSVIYFLDVVRDGFGKINLTVKERMEDFFLNSAVIVEIICLVLVVAAAISRLVDHSSATYVYPHTIYTLACVVYWLKTLRLFFVTESVGPKVITLFNMLRDLAFFLLIYAIVLLSFSVPIYTLAYPHRHMTDGSSYFSLLLDICYNRMWNIFYVGMEDTKRIVEGTCGSQLDVSTKNNNVSMTLNETALIYRLIMNATDETDTDNNENQVPVTASRCPSRNILAIILFLIYLMLSFIMLLNMVVAMFAHTVERTRLSATRLWRFDMYRILYDYYNRPVLPGPLMVFELTYRFGCFLYRQACGSQQQLDENTDLKHFYESLDDYDYRKMEMFERSASDALIMSRPANISSQSTRNHTLTLTKMFSAIERIYRRLDNLENKLSKPSEADFFVYSKSVNQKAANIFHSV